ncbi:MAG: HigA family addiction module antitoxin [Campylobacterota bacterium]|nr:HigA family addiction module antitoxin [Campylobacterota bacterium]
MIRKPIHPGVFLKEFMSVYNLNQKQTAQLTCVSAKTISDIVNEKRGVNTLNASKFSKLFGTCNEFWLNSSMKYDLWVKSNKSASKE